MSAGLDNAFPGGPATHLDAAFEWLLDDACVPPEERVFLHGQVRPVPLWGHGVVERGEGENSGRGARKGGEGEG